MMGMVRCYSIKLRMLPILTGYKKGDEQLKALFFLYEGYVEWEISPLSYLLNATGVEVETTAISEEITHMGKFKVKVDHKIESCNPEDYDVLIIPGGDPSSFDQDEHVLNFIRYFDEQGKWMAAICGGTHLLAASRTLRGRKCSAASGEVFRPENISETDVTVSENLITAEGNAYIEFAVAVGKKLNIFKDREDELETVLYFKNQLRA